MARRVHKRTSIAEANRGGQQLFIANLHHARRSRRAEPLHTPVGVALHPLTHRQLTLFAPPRDLRAGQRHGFPPPPDPVLAERLTAELTDYAAHHGWSARTSKKARRGLQILLALQDTSGAPILASLIYQLPTLDLPARVLHEFLDTCRLVEDDRTPAIEGWFRRQVEGLPDPMRDELQLWFDIRWHGHGRAPRSTARSQNTIRIDLRFSIPVLRSWAAQGTQSLREITRAEVLASLPEAGNKRHHTIAGLRAIFRTLKAHRVIFRDPRVHIRVGAPEQRTPLPADLAMLREGLLSPDPTRAALTALLAFHALRAGQIRALKLTDVHDGRPHLGDQVILLAEPARLRLNAYLDFRHQRWPGTANPHLFIHYRTALGTQPVGGRWLGLVLGTPARVIRTDRILHEVRTTGGDLRRICDLFGLSVPAALRYTATVGTPDRSTGQHSP